MDLIDYDAIDEDLPSTTGAGSPYGTGKSTRRDVLARAAALGLTVAGARLLQASPAFAASEPSGTIHFTNYQGWIGKGEYAAFKKKYPKISIKESYLFDPNAEITKIVSGQSKADLGLFTAENIAALAQAGKAGTIDLSQVPNYKLVRPAFKKDGFSDQQAHGVVTDWSRWGIIYRSDLVREKIHSWADFYRVAAKYPGKFAIHDWQRSGICSVMIALGLSPNSTNPSDIDKAKKFLIDHKSVLGPLLSADFGKHVIKGDLYAIMDWEWDGRASIQKNKKIVWTDTADGIFGTMEGWVPVKGSKVMPAVHAFMDYGLAPAAYGNFINTVAAPYVLPKSVLAPHLSPLNRKDDYFLYPPARIVKRIVFHRYLGAAQRMWDDAWAAFKAA